MSEENSPENVETIAKGIIDSIESEKLLSTSVQKDAEDGISLLALKNEALLSYINNLVLIAKAQIEKNSPVLERARRRSIEQRVVLEKGIKGLETKITYQVDKVLRAYSKSLEQLKQEQESESKDDPTVEMDSDDDDLTSFRPNISSLTRPSGSSHREPGSDGEENSKRIGKYIAPKISATSFNKGEASNGSRARRSQRRDFAMEEYLQDAGDAPTLQPSIGSTIMDHGRGGMRTEREQRRDKEVRDYEEDNFTRISTVSAKKSRKDAMQRQRDAMSKSFFGEDWGFLDKDSRNDRSKKRKTGGHSAGKKRRRSH